MLSRRHLPDHPLWDLGLDSGTTHALIRSGYRRVEDVQRVFSDGSRIVIRNIGETRIADIRLALSRFGQHPSEAGC